MTDTQPANKSIKRLTRIETPLEKSAQAQRN